jgi:hypothetical protein
MSLFFKDYLGALFVFNIFTELDEFFPIAPVAREMKEELFPFLGLDESKTFT